ncbi:hypothetical protein GCM10009682_61780 [Luedemannella flava]|uniref:Uncharacterized protein n=1 Tax=Luedemannella flava TaxID=349316 RepID=A0ABP4YYY1_9ACTN
MCRQRVNYCEVSTTAGGAKPLILKDRSERLARRVIHELVCACRVAPGDGLGRAKVAFCLGEEHVGVVPAGRHPLEFAACDQTIDRTTALFPSHEDSRRSSN